MKKSIRTIESYLTERNSKIETDIQDLFKLLAAKEKLGSGDAAVGVRDICIEELSQNSLYFVQQLVLEKRLYSRRMKDGEIQNSLINYINSRIIFLNEKRMDAMKQAFRGHPSESMLEASSPQSSFNRIKNNTNVMLDEELLRLKESKGKTLKARIQYELENNWFYILLVFGFAIYEIIEKV